MKIGDHISAVDDNISGLIISEEKGHFIIEDIHGFEHRIQKSKAVPVMPELYKNSAVEAKTENFKKISKKNSDTVKVLDLHFEKLVKNPQEIPGWERILIQKQKLLETLEYCREHRLKKLKIIHGIGDGILQQMVFETLRHTTGIQFEDDGFFYHTSGEIYVEFV